MPEVRYTTHSMYYAAYLVYMGFNFVELLPSTRKPDLYEFGFEWIGNVKEYESEFFTERAQVEPRAYLQALNDLRDVLNKQKAKDRLKTPYK